MTNTTTAPALDYTNLDRAWMAKIAATGMSWSGGRIWRATDNPNADKNQTCLNALHAIAQQHRDGTLPGFGSHREAGAYFWTLVHNCAAEMNLTGDARWRRNYSNDQVACEEIGRWLNENRTVIQALPLVAVVPAHDFSVGDLAVMEGRFVRVIRTNLATRTSLVFWYDDRNRYQEQAEVPWASLTWAEPGVQRVRRKASIASGYTGYGLAADNEYVFDRVYTATDRAIHVRLPGGDTSYMCQNDFEPVGGQILATREVAYRQQDAWFLDTGLLGYVEDNDRHARGHSRTAIGVHVYSNTVGSWGLETYPVADLYLAQEGDECVLAETERNIPAGTRVEYVRPTSRTGSRDIVVRWAGDEYTVQRHRLRFAHTQPVTPAPPKPNPVVVIDGIEYVRKDVIDADVETMKSTLHKGSVEHSLCGVYDRVTAQSDARTDYVKLGQRYRNYDVVVEQTVTVRRTIRVEQATDEDTARTNARRIANDYPPRTIEAPRRGESALTVASWATTDHRGTATVVG